MTLDTSLDTLLSADYPVNMLPSVGRLVVWSNQSDYGRADIRGMSDLGKTSLSGNPVATAKRRQMEVQKYFAVILPTSNVR